MTISTAQSRVRYAGNDVTVAFAVPFKFHADGDLVVLLRNDAAETDAVQTLTTHYTVSGAGDDSGGTVTMVTAPATGETLIIYLDPPLTQAVDYAAGDAFPAETHEDALDRLVNLAKRTRERVSRTPGLVEGDLDDGTGRYDANSNRIINVADPESAQEAATWAWVKAEIDKVSLADFTSTVTAFAATLLDDADAATARTTLGLAIGTDVQAFDADTAKLDVVQEWTRQQNFNATTLTDGASIAWDLDLNQVASVTLGGNRTLANPTNKKDGATYILIVRQDGTGGRTLAYGTDYLWPGGTAPVLSTGANDIDILTFICDGTNMFGTSSLDFS